MTIYVYLITRTDNTKYVGITLNMNKRLSEHRRSKRFESGVKEHIALSACDDYSEARKLEEYFITKYDTYNNGLNMTPNGGKLKDCEKFNTLGLKFSDETKSKMCENHWSKTGSYRQNGRTLSKETKDKMSAGRVGKFHGSRKVSKDEVIVIIESYKNNSIDFEDEFVKQFVKSSDKERVGSVGIKQLTTPNGKSLTLEKLYAEYYARLFGVTPNAIRGILNGKSTKSIEHSSLNT